ncbi:MAG: hypothetical protein WA020_12105 [Candidatus Acidiferrales bacterium]
MKFAKRLLMVAGAVALAGLVGVMLAPKAVHAVVATLVEVENTSANPVPVTDGTDIAEQPFETTICKDTGSGICGALATAVGLSVTPPASFTVPATDSAGDSVKMLVIRFVSGICGGPTSAPALLTSVPANAVNGVTTAVNFLDLGVLPTTTTSGTTVIGEVNVDTPTNIVAAPGSTVSMFAELSSGSGCWLTVNGYLAH